MKTLSGEKIKYLVENWKDAKRLEELINNFPLEIGPFAKGFEPSFLISFSYVSSQEKIVYAIQEVNRKVLHPNDPPMNNKILSSDKEVIYIRPTQEICESCFHFGKDVDYTRISDEENEELDPSEKLHLLLSHTSFIAYYKNQEYHISNRSTHE